MQIGNSVFVVTGGSSGLGAGTPRMLVAAGGKVVLADVNKTVGEALVNELGANARFVETDVVNEESARQAIDTARGVFGGLHGLVNCAGIAPAEKVVGRDGVHRLATFARVININLVGTFNMIRLAAEAMSQAGPNAGKRKAQATARAFLFPAFVDLPGRLSRPLLPRPVARPDPALSQRLRR